MLSIVFINTEREIMSIVDFESFKNRVNKFDAIAKPVTPKLNPIFSDDSVSDKMKKFFDIADGNSIWTD